MCFLIHFVFKSQLAVTQSFRRSLSIATKMETMRAASWPGMTTILYVSHPTNAETWKIFSRMYAATFPWPAERTRAWTSPRQRVSRQTRTPEARRRRCLEMTPQAFMHSAEHVQGLAVEPIIRAFLTLKVTRLMRAGVPYPRPLHEGGGTLSATTP